MSKKEKVINKSDKKQKYTRITPEQEQKMLQLVLSGKETGYSLAKKENKQFSYLRLVLRRAAKKAGLVEELEETFKNNRGRNRISLDAKNLLDRLLSGKETFSSLAKELNVNFNTIRSRVAKEAKKAGLEKELNEIAKKNKTQRGFKISLDANECLNLILSGKDNYPSLSRKLNINFYTIRRRVMAEAKRLGVEKELSDALKAKQILNNNGRPKIQLGDLESHLESILNKKETLTSLSLKLNVSITTLRNAILETAKNKKPNYLEELNGILKRNRGKRKISLNDNDMLQDVLNNKETFSSLSQKTNVSYMTVRNHVFKEAKKLGLEDKLKEVIGK